MLGVSLGRLELNGILRAEDSLARLLKPAYKKAAFRVNWSRPIVFVCGGKSSTKTLRHQFLGHIPKRSPRVLAVLAEQAFPHQLVERNIQEFEASIAKAADCVLIFAESVGSFAETGLFSALPNIASKTLVVNMKKNSRADSFLNKGPIKLIARRSKFEDVVILNRKKVTRANANEIVGRITATLPPLDNALVFHPTTKFGELDLRLQLGCVYLVVRVVQVGSSNLFTSILRTYFRAVPSEHIERYLSILVSLRLICREDDLYYNLDPLTFQNDLLINKFSDYGSKFFRLRYLQLSPPRFRLAQRRHLRCALAFHHLVGDGRDHTRSPVPFVSYFGQAL